MFFENRIDAGQKLAQIFLNSDADFSTFDVVGIARGGVVIAGEIAKALHRPLHSLLLATYNGPNVTIKVSSVGTGFVIPANATHRGFPVTLESQQLTQFNEFVATTQERGRMYNGGEELSIGENVIICDDGFVSGVSIFAAIEALKTRGAKKFVVGVPVVLPWIMEAKKDFDIVTWRVSKKKGHVASGIFYFNFEDTPDEQVIDIIRSSRKGVLV